MSGCHSDNEEDRASRNGRQDNLEFKDEEETVTTKSIQITQATETTTTTTRKRSGATGGKTLDLGAAAHYTGDKSPEEKVPMPTLFHALNASACSLTQSVYFCLKSSKRHPSNSSVVADLLVIDPSPKQGATTGKFTQTHTGKCVGWKKDIRLKVLSCASRCKFRPH